MNQNQKCITINSALPCTNVLLHQGPLSFSAAVTKGKYSLPPFHLIELMLSKFTLKHNMKRGNLRLTARKLISSEWKSTVTIR